jgi:uncharacterized membrane protein
MRETDTGVGDRPFDWTVPPHTSVLVTGRSSDTVDGVARELVASRQEPAGGVLVSTRDPSVDLVTGTESVLDCFDDARTGVVDCTPGRGTSFAGRDALTWNVSSPTAFTGIAVAVSECLATLRERGVATPWVVFDSLSTLLVSADSTDVVRFAHALHAQVTVAGGIAVFPVHTNVTNGTDLERCKHVANVQVDVRKRAGTREYRVRGLDDGPASWQALDETGPVTGVGVP